MVTSPNYPSLGGNPCISINPFALHARGWTEDLIHREETAGAVEIVEGQARKRSKGRMKYTLRVKVTSEALPVAVALIKAKVENLPSGHGMEPSVVRLQT